MEPRVRYRTVLAHREFRGMYAAFSLSLIGDQLARVALAVLVFRRTGSPLQTSATYAVSYGAYLLTGPVLAGLADRYPRLTVMVACDLLRVPLVLLLALSGLPMPVVFGLIALLGATSPAFDSARSALQPDVLDGELYVVGNTLTGVTVQLSNAVGFVLGGTIVALSSVRAALVLDAATFLCSAGLLLRAVRHRPVPLDPAEHPTGDALAGFRLVLARADLRTLVLCAVLGSVAVTSTEGLAVPVAQTLGGGPFEAGLLTAAAPVGYLLASTRVLRTAPTARLPLLPPLVLLSCLPLLATPLLPGLALVLALWVAAGIGGAVNLVAGPAFVQRVPAALRGRAYGVASTALQVSQGLGLLVAGALAGVLTPRWAAAAVGALTALVAVPALGAQGTRELVRKVR